MVGISIWKRFSPVAEVMLLLVWSRVVDTNNFNAFVKMIRYSNATIYHHNRCLYLAIASSFHEPKSPARICFLASVTTCR